MNRRSFLTALAATIGAFGHRSQVDIEDEAGIWDEYSAEGRATWARMHAQRLQSGMSDWTTESLWNQMYTSQPCAKLF